MFAVGVLHGVVNLLLLAGAARLSEWDGAWWRMGLSAGLGAGYAAACTVWGWLGAPLYRAASLLGMVLTAYGPNWQPGALFVLLNLSVGGIALAAGEGRQWAAPVSAVGVWLLGKWAMGGRLLRVEIAGERLMALRDTGNELRDPVSGEAVLVIAAEPARRLTGLTSSQLADPLESLTGAPVPGLRVIPYHAVGTQTGFLLAKRFDEVRIGGRRRPAVVAFAPTDLGGEVYQALAGRRM